MGEVTRNMSDSLQTPDERQSRVNEIEGERNGNEKEISTQNCDIQVHCYRSMRCRKRKSDGGEKQEGGEGRGI